MVGELRVNIAAAATFTLKKGQSGQQTVIQEMLIAASVNGFITISDGSQTDIIYLYAGVNEFCYPLKYKADADVTIVPTTSTVSIFGTYKQS